MGARVADLRVTVAGPAMRVAPLELIWAHPHRLQDVRQPLIVQDAGTSLRGELFVVTTAAAHGRRVSVSKVEEVTCIEIAIRAAGRDDGGRIHFVGDRA